MLTYRDDDWRVAGVGLAGPPVGVLAVDDLARLVQTAHRLLKRRWKKKRVSSRSSIKWRMDENNIINGRSRSLWARTGPY